MVHALKKAAGLLKPGGVLLEIHDILDPPRIEIQRGENTNFIGQLQNKNNFENQRMAEQAVIMLIQNGILTSVKSHIFEYLFIADSIADLYEWLEDTWENAYLLDETRQLIKERFNEEGRSDKIVIRLISRMIMLKPIDSFQ